MRLDRALLAEYRALLAEYRALLAEWRAHTSWRYVRNNTWSAHFTENTALFAEYRALLRSITND